MNNYSKICLLLVICCLILNGLSCSEKPLEQLPSNNSLIDATGQSISLGILPQRIISLAPSLTENVYLLGCGEQIVGVTVYCEYPPAAKTKTKIGNLLNPDIEKIITLKPDLVLATKDGNKPEVVKSIRELAIPVFVFSQVNTLADIKQGFLQLARLLDKEKETQAILNRAEEKISLIRSRVNQLSPKKVFVQLGIQPIMTAAQNTFVDEIIALAGGINIAHDSKIRYPIYSLEAIISQDPEMIIITDMGNISRQAQKDWAKFTGLAALKNDNIVLLDKEATHYFCAPSLSGFVRSLELVAGMIHPE